MALHYLTHQVQVMLSLLACFPLSSSKNWISSLVPSLDKLFLISFNVPLRYPNTFSWFHLTYHCTPQIHFLDFINRTIALPKYIFLISFNVPLRYPNTFSWFHLTYHCTPQIHFLDFINRTIVLPKYIFLISLIVPLHSPNTFSMLSFLFYSVTLNQALNAFVWF